MVMASSAQQHHKRSQWQKSLRLSCCKRSSALKPMRASTGALTPEQTYIWGLHKRSQWRLSKPQ